KFFLFLHYFDPHFAYMLHDQYNYFPDYKGEVKSRMSTHVLRENAHNYSENDLKYLRALYDSEISFTDYYIGKVINHLKALNLYNNTIIIFTADHGESFSDHLCWIGHTKSLYQELIHVPLIIKPAGKNEHMKVNKYTGTINILPTILSALQIKKPKNINFNGTEIDLTDINKIENRVIISDTKRMSLLESVISDRYKVIKGKLWDYYKPSEHTYEIYDLRNDPQEKHNLYPGIDNDDIHDLKLILEEWNTYVHSQQSKIGKVKSPQLSKKERERLRSLGYM
ncbi:MAG: sulfatase-like hydrolase/transferase, partial [bacterium]